MQVKIITRTQKAYLVADSIGRKAWYPEGMVTILKEKTTVPEFASEHKDSFDSHAAKFLKDLEASNAEKAALKENLPPKPEKRTPEEIAESALRRTAEHEAIKAEFQARVQATDGPLPLVAKDDIPLGALSMMSTIKDKVEGSLKAVARVAGVNAKEGTTYEYLVYVKAEAPTAIVDVTNNIVPARRTARVRN